LAAQTTRGASSLETFAVFGSIHDAISMSSPIALGSISSVSALDARSAWRYFFWAATGCAYAPLLLKFAARLWATDHYSFFPLLLIASSLLIYLRVREQKRFKPGATAIQVVGISLSFLLLATGVLLTSPYLAAISALCMILSLVYAFGRWTLVRAILPVWLLLWLAIPLPLGFDGKLIIALQRIATAHASGILDAANYWHYLDGMIIHRPARSYQVEEACSGIHSLFSSLFFTGLYLILTKTGPVRSILVLVSAFFWVVVANVGRVVLVVVLVDSFGIPVDRGLPHSILGMFVFLGCLGLIAGTERFFAYVWPPSGTKRRRQKKRARKHDALAPLPARTLSMAAVCFSVLVLIQFISFVSGGSIDAGELTSIRLLESDGADLLPVHLAGWQQTGYERVTRAASNSNGSISRVWSFEREERRCHVSIDGPFLGWHNLGDCLQSQGWTLQDWSTKSYDSGIGGFVEVSVSKRRGEQALVVFGLFDPDSRPFQVPAGSFIRRFERRFSNVVAAVKQLFGIGHPAVAHSDSRSYQLQVFMECAGPFADDDASLANAIFHATRRHISSIGER
jgi:exosortase